MVNNGTLPAAQQLPQAQLPQAQPAQPIQQVQQTSTPQAPQAPNTQRQSNWDPDLHIPGEGVRDVGMSVFLFGGLGSWKTSWAGTWPSPVFLSAGVEGGDDALAMLPHITGCPTPPVYQITSCSMMKRKVEYICRNYVAYGWKTVVIDSITFYADMWMRELFEEKIKAKKEPAMITRDWGLLEAHMIKEIAQQLHRTKLNVIWIALQKEITNTEPDGSTFVKGVKPYIQGATSVKLPAMCKLVIHAHKELLSDTQNPGRMITKPVYFTSPSMLAKDIRHKYGHCFPEGRLVDPEHGDWPTYRAVESRIGQFIYR